MKKGRFENKSVKTVPIWLIVLEVVVVIALLVVLAVLISGNSGGPADNNDVTQNATVNHVPEDTAALEDTAVNGNDGTTKSQEADENTTAPEDTQIEDTDTTGSTQDQEAHENTQLPSQTQEPELETMAPPADVVQRADAEYEKWLSAAMIVCVSMEYPDFQLEGVYAASATALEDKYSSEGAYIVFISGGERIVIHSKALEEERVIPGTVDISTETVGYATFDPVDPDSVDLDSLEQLPLEDLSELISQSLLVSIYTR